MNLLKNKALPYMFYLYIIIQAIVPTKIRFRDSISYGDALFFILILVYLINFLIFREVRQRFLEGIKNFFTDYLSISMFVLFCIMVFSITYSADKALALGETIRFSLYIIMFFIIKFEMNSKEVFHNIINIYIGVCTAVSVLGIIQYFTKIGLDKQFIYYGKGLSVDFRITSTMDNPNTLGAFLVLAIFPLLSLTFSKKNKGMKLVYGSLSLIVFSNILLSMSRNAWLGLLVGIFLIIILYNWKAIILLILGGALSLTLSPVRSRIKDFSTILDNPRIKMWKIAIKMIKDHPIFGVGNGNYTALYGEYIKKYPELKYGIYTEFPTHNSYLKIQSELGIPGITIFVLMLLSIILKLKNMMCVAKDEVFKGFYKGFFVSAIVFLMMNISDNLLFVPKISMYFWIFVAISQSIIYNNIYE